MATRQTVRQRTSLALKGETFLRAPSCTADEVNEGQVAVLGIPHDLTKISRSGASEGPAAVRQATLMFGFAVEEMARGDVIDIDLNRRFRYRSGQLVDAGDVKLGEDVDQNIASISEAAAKVGSRGAIPLALGGDHFVTYPLVSGLLRGRETASLGCDIAYLHVDMHLDLADDVPGFGRFASGTPVRRLIEDRALDPSRILIWGAESFQHTNEWQFAMDNGITVVSSCAVGKNGSAASIREPLERVLDGADGLYVSIDIDVVARMYAPGTGNAAGVNGLAPRDILGLLRVVRQEPLVGIDLVEVAPRWDPTGVTAGVAASFLTELLWPRLFETLQ